MKPRTKIQREVAALFPSLPPLSNKQREYAEENCHSKFGYFSCGEVWCTHCGRISGNLDPMDFKAEETEYVCPFCGAKTTIKKGRGRRKFSQKWYYTIITTFKGWQVIRHFICFYDVTKGTMPSTRIAEVVQKWLKEDGTQVIVARKCTLHGGDSWDFHSEMEIREKCRTYGYYGYYSSDKYDIWSEYFYPEYRVLPIFKRNGFNITAVKKSMPPCSLLTKLVTDTETEYLVKTRQYSLLNYFKYKRGIGCGRYMHAIKICNRNGYKVKDASMWVDYIDLLEWHHLDTHNAHYVCPKDLKKAHDKLDARKQRIQAKRKAEEDRLNAIKWEKDYKKSKGAYFGICFGDDEIQIAVITSVADMADEGNAMHHCVYSMRYFNRADSLILSARDKDGNRIETIELSLKTFEVVQSRGKCNELTPFHDKILKLVQDNVSKFRNVA